ncbi:MAG: hypothetical protein A2V85_11545 [Chloroflexi bacterium RBG_16_72_14]|nr:MAG: hypothetical protein A2V85_11545 [Chloroflexi bacterium RBG_16_72_14]
MTRRLAIEWPDGRPFAGRDGRPIRILAASDDVDPALEHAGNREAIGPIDLVAGSGDLSPDWLGFLGDAFRAPLVYVRGNHDRRDPWPAPATLPTPATWFDDRTLPGLPLLALPWPSFGREVAPRDERDAWLQVLRLGPRGLLRGAAPILVLSHAPPRGAGDTPTDAYHVGFAAYRLVARRLRPPLWLHGHTSPAAQEDWRVDLGPTTFANVTGSVLVELLPPAGR